MYASMRRIKCVAGKASEVAQRIEEQFVPQMRAMSGFVAYYLVDLGGDEVRGRTYLGLSQPSSFNPL